MMFLILAMVALVLDGGSLMLNRRSAQVAADAGALAGAKLMCQNASESTIIAGANNYVTLNKGIPVETIIKPSGEISVTTQVTNNSFFAKIFGVNNLTSKALAQAGCFSPGNANGVLPVAWACKAPIAGKSDSSDCEIRALDWTTEMKPLVTGSPSSVSIHELTNPITTPVDFAKDSVAKQPTGNGLSKYLYVIMDSGKLADDLSSTCISGGGTMVCDLDGDGVDDIMGGGDRSWLDLDGGGGGAADMKNWVLYGFSGNLAIHTWLAGQTGVDTAVYHAVETVIKRYPPTYPVVIIPVFDAICIGNPLEHPDTCIKVIPDHNPIPPAEKVVATSGKSTTYFHISGFAGFYITCVDQGGGSCPGSKLLGQMNPGMKMNSVKTIEGYFVEGYPFDLGNPGTGGDDLGVYVISLTK